MRLLSFVLTLAFVAAFAWPDQVAAQHSDIDFFYQNGKIQLEEDDHDHGLVFEGNFPTGGAFARFTTNPGFGSESIAGLGINPGDIVGYNVLDDLFYWDALTASFASPGSAAITIGNSPFGSTVVNATSGFQEPGGIIGQAAGNGDFHSHISFQLSSGAAFGAYGLLLELTTDADGIANSDPFFIVFNYGLSHATFEQAADAFAGYLVPEPSAFALFALGAIPLAVAVRRRCKA